MATRFAGGGAPSHVLGVVTSLSERRREHLEGMDSEYESNRRWLADAISSSKRRILESAGMTAPVEAASESGPDGSKRRRVGSIEPAAGGAVAAEAGKENGDPNVVVAAVTGKPNNNGNNIEEAKGAGSDNNVTNAKGKTDKPNDGRSGGDDDCSIDVYSLKVAQLRAELRSRGMDAAGLKKDLQARLAARIEEERREATAGRDSGGASAAEEEGNEEMETEEADGAKVAAEEEEGKVGTTEVIDVDARMETSPVPVVEGVVDFPGVDVKALSAKKGSPEREQERLAEGGAVGSAAAVDGADAMDVESATAPVVTGDERDVEMDDADSLGRSSSVESHSNTSHPKRVSSTSSYQTCNSDGSMEADGEDVDAEEDKETEVMQQSSKSPKKKNIGRKLLKATSKLFSPNSKKTGGGQVRANTSPKQGTSQLSEGRKEQTQNSRASDLAPQDTSSTVQLVPSAVTANPPSARKVKAAADFFSKLATDPSQPAPPPSKLGSALKTPAIRGALAASGSTSGGSKNSATSSSSSSSSRSAADPRIRALKENAEARKARLAELRAKSKPVHLSKPSDKAKAASADVSALRTAMSSTKSGGLTSTADKQKEEKRKLLAAQMREKHAAEAAKKQQQARTVPSAQPSKPAVPATAQNSQQQPQQTPRQQPAAPAQQKSASNLKPTSPMDTYEISDREESDTDSSDYDSEDDAPKKKIPKWAQKANLIPALERQFMDGPGRLDPDEIFPEVSTCNLELVFDQKKSRYQKRTSSGNWTKDRVTAAEKLVYKRTMGFQK